MGVTWIAERPEATLFVDPGLGKTSMTLDAFLKLRKAGYAKKLLVVAPKRVCYLVWSHDGEIGKWSNFADLKVTLLHGKDKDERLDEDADVYVVNFDGLRWLCESGGLKKLMAKGVDTLALDELSKFKDARGKTFKMVRPHFAKFATRWGLTGSPAPNGLIDLFGQLLIIDKGRTLGTYITDYRHNYFLPAGYKGYEWRLKEGGDEAIYEAIGDVALSMRAIDHLDLPPLIEQDVRIELPEKARATYSDLEDDLFSLLDNHEIYAANAAVASGKCRQVASGGLYLDDPEGQKSKRETLTLHDEKTQALRELVDELQGKPLLVFYEFNHDYERIAKAFKSPPVINGKLDDRKLSALVNKWNAGELPILCGHPRAMGHGLNLQASGSHIAWYTLTWDYELYDQAIRRVWRQGTKAERIYVHRILGRNTLDEVVAKVISAKRRGQDALLSALNERRIEREAT